MTFRTKHTRLEFHLGTGEDRDGKPIHPERQVGHRQRMLYLTASRYGGASITEQTGAWINPEGVFVSEPGVTVVAYLEGHDNGYAHAQNLMKIGNQRACLVACFGPDGQHTFTEVFAE